MFLKAMWNKNPYSVVTNRDKEMKKDIEKYLEWCRNCIVSICIEMLRALYVVRN